MDAVIRFGAIVLADLRERTRSARFRVILAAMMLASWWCVPGPTDSYMILALPGGERGFYSSAWIGMALAMAFNLLLGLGGFYLVRGTLVRDIETRVWQLLVATPMTRAGFLLAKWASHMVVFGVIIVACLGVALVAQWVRAEDRAVDLLELVKPTMLLALPGLAVTAAAAIWFDLLPPLRRTAGNVLFFVLWTFALAGGVSRLEVPDSMARTGWVSDPGGLIVAARDLRSVRIEQTGKQRKYGFSIGSPRPQAGPVRFEWKSWTVRPMDAFGRLLWLLLAMGLVLSAAPVLDRVAARTPERSNAGAGSRLELRWLERVLRPLARGTFATLAVMELQATLRERARAWWVVALVAVGMQTFGSAEALRVGMLLAWLLPIDVLARGILRERDHRTGSLVFTAPHAATRVLGVRFAVPVLMLLLLTAPGMVRLALAMPMGALAVVAVAASITSWGIACGALFRNARPFELVLVGALYLAFQGATLFDVAAAPGATLAGHVLAAALAWVVIAMAWPRTARAG